jgi:ubiquitin-like protein Nedd8
MQIQIKTLDGEKRNFNFEKEHKFSHVKDILAEKTGVFKEMIRLIYNGIPMKDDATLEEANVVAGAVIHMIMQLRG